MSTSLTCKCLAKKKKAKKVPTDTRTILLETASKLFSEYGYDAVSTRMIAEMSNVNLGGIHYHFGSKEALYTEVVRVAIDAGKSSRIEDLLCEEPMLIQSPEGKAELIRRIVSDYFHRCFQLSESWKSRLILREMCEHSPVHAKLVKEIFTPESERMLRLFRILRPGGSESDAYIWAHLPSSQSAFYLMAKSSLEQIYDKTYLRELGQNVIRTITKTMILLLDLPVPDDLK